MTNRCTCRRKTQCLPVLISLDILINPKYNNPVLIRKAYKYRLKTKSNKETRLEQFAGCCRLVWNKAFTFQKERRDNKKSCLSYNKMADMLRQCKSVQGGDFPESCAFSNTSATAMNILTAGMPCQPVEKCCSQTAL